MDAHKLIYLPDSQRSCFCVVYERVKGGWNIAKEQHVRKSRGEDFPEGPWHDIQWRTFTFFFLGNNREECNQVSGVNIFLQCADYRFLSQLINVFTCLVILWSMDISEDRCRWWLWVDWFLQWYFSSKWVQSEFRGKCENDLEHSRTWEKNIVKIFIFLYFFITMRVV